MVEITDDGPLVEAPGAVATGLAGVILPAPFGPTATSQLLVGPACTLCGWSIRESTGLAGAIVELISGSTAGGELLGTIALTAGFDPTASQTPAASAQNAANAALAVSIVAGAGLFAFVTSLRVTGEGATAATTVIATLTGGQGGTISYPIAVPAAVAGPITPVTDSFGTRGLQSAAMGGTITLNVPAFGAGNTLAQAQITGYVQATAGSERTVGPDDVGIQARNGIFLSVLQGSVKGTVWFKV